MTTSSALVHVDPCCPRQVQRQMSQPASSVRHGITEVVPMPMLREAALLGWPACLLCACYRVLGFVETHPTHARQQQQLLAGPASLAVLPWNGIEVCRLLAE
jgi:hypothetical protein